MNRFLKVLIFSFTCVVILQNSYAQTTKHNIALVDGYAFEDIQNGVKKYTAVQEQVNREFKPQYDELTALQSKADGLRKQAQSNPSAADSQKKLQEADDITKSIRLKQDNYQTNIQSRYRKLMEPLQSKIAELIKKWGNEKGYTAVVDVSKDDKGFFLWVDDAALNATTKALIDYLNNNL